MSISLLGEDVSGKVINSGQDNAILSTIEGVLLRAIEYELADSEGEYSPFIGSSQLALRTWRDSDVTEVNTTVNGRNFSGQIKDASTAFDDRGYVTRLKTEENVAIYLNGFVEEGTSNNVVVTDNPAQSNQVYYPEGSTQIYLTSALAAYEKGKIYFSGTSIPRYVITDVSVTANYIVLDRGLDEPIGASGNNTDQDAIVITPVTNTIPDLLYNALTTVITDPKRYGSSFRNFSIAEQAYTASVLITREDRVTLREYLGRLLTIDAFYLVVNDSGVIEIVRPRKYNNQTIPYNDEITINEIMSPYSISFDNTTYEGFQMPYFTTNTVSSLLQVENYFDYADDAVIAEYKNRGILSPVDVSTSDVANYNILAGNAVSAEYYVNQMMDQFQYPRVKIECSAKAFKDDDPANLFECVLGKQVSVSIPTSTYDNFIQEPAIIAGYSVDRSSQRINNFVLLLNNAIFPRLPVVKDEMPVITSLSYTRPTYSTSTITWGGGSPAWGTGAAAWSQTTIGRLNVQATPAQDVWIIITHKFTKELIYKQIISVSGIINVNIPDGVYLVKLRSKSGIFISDEVELEVS